MPDKDPNFKARKYMELAVEEMKKSIQEPRDDKTSPKVGAVLIKPNGTVETAHRGELRHGDHAEFTLLERKNRKEKLDDSILFATLEPCAPNARKHPKLGCAERIVNARIKKVWVGVEDPDPTVDRKGIKHLQDNGIEVELFDRDLQDIIWKENEVFKKEALQRAKIAEKKPKEHLLSPKEAAVQNNIDVDDFSKEAVQAFLAKEGLDVELGSSEFIRTFKQLELIASENEPTGVGLLLFGKNPHRVFPQAVIRATYKTAGRKEDIHTIEGPLVEQPKKIMDWFETHIGKQINRTKAGRITSLDFPADVFRESVINAIVHRDYDIEGAPIYVEISDVSIMIRSPGEPVPPLTRQQVEKLTAPSLSRNPKIMYVFDKMELVEQRGLGFDTIKELPDKHHLPLPIISFDAPYMVMSFPRSDADVKKLLEDPRLEGLNAEEVSGWRWINNKGEVSSREYANQFNIGYKKAQRQLAKMRDLGLITDNGEATNSPKYRYRTVT